MNDNLIGENGEKQTIGEMGIDMIPNFRKVSFDDFMSDIDDSVDKDPQQNQQNLPQSDNNNRDEWNYEGNNNLSIEDNEENNESKSEDNPYKILANFAKENGLIEFDEKEFNDNSPDEFIISKYQETLNKRVESALKEIEDNYPEEIKELIANYRDGVPLMDLIQSKSRIQELSNIKQEELNSNKELQRELISMFLQEHDFTPEEINIKIEKYEDAGLLEEEANLALKKLISIEEKYKDKLIQESKQRQIQEREMAEKQLKEIENRVMSRKELFPGIDYTDEVKRKVLNAMIKPISKIGDKPINLIAKAQMEDPDFWEKVAYMVVNKWDMTPFQKKAATDQARRLKETINNTSFDKTKKSTVNINNIRKAVEKMKNKINYL
jgi:hypothetical protein